MFGIQVKSQSKLSYGQSASQYWYQATIWDLRPIFLSFPYKLYVDICGFVITGVASLTRRRVCNLLVHVLLGIGSAVTLGSKSRRPSYSLYSLTWDTAIV
jgi:hypothetical protein